MPGKERIGAGKIGHVVWNHRLPFNTRTAGRSTPSPIGNSKQTPYSRRRIPDLIVRHVFFPTPSERPAGSLDKQRKPEDHAPDSPLATALREFCLDGGKASGDTFPSVPAWQPLLDRGTELWLDTGDIDAAKELWCREFAALTTNNTLLNREVQKGIYDDVVPQAAKLIRAKAPGISDRDLVLETAFVLNAKHGLALWRQFGAKVSVELHTDLANDIEASVAYGRRYAAIHPTHFIVKVPLTPSGLVAARRLADDGIPVNFTLGFSARQNLLIARVAKPQWCNVFMGRINAFIAKHGLGDGKNAGERATAASQRVVAELRASGVAPTKQIGASMRGGEQVPALAGLDVYTMPTKVAHAWLASPTPIEDGIQAEFPVEFAPGVDADAEKLHVFWDVDEASSHAVDALAKLDVAKLDADSVRGALSDAGCASYFPTLDAAQRATITKDGKIPVYETWKADVRAGKTAWDTQLTLGGLASFSADQANLDERIRGHL